MFVYTQELQQHDVQELNRILFSAIESSLLGTSGEQLISKLYHGSAVQQVSIHNIVCMVRKCIYVVRRCMQGMHCSWEYIGILLNFLIYQNEIHYCGGMSLALSQLCSFFDQLYMLHVHALSIYAPKIYQLCSQMYQLCSKINCFLTFIIL